MHQPVLYSGERWGWVPRSPQRPLRDRQASHVVVNHVVVPCCEPAQHPVETEFALRPDVRRIQTRRLLGYPARARTGGVRGQGSKRGERPTLNSRRCLMAGAPAFCRWPSSGLVILRSGTVL